MNYSKPSTNYSVRSVTVNGSIPLTRTLNDGKPCTIFGVSNVRGLRYATHDIPVNNEPPREVTVKELISVLRDAGHGVNPSDFYKIWDYVVTPIAPEDIHSLEAVTDIITELKWVIALQEDLPKSKGALIKEVSVKYGIPIEELVIGGAHAITLNEYMCVGAYTDILLTEENFKKINPVTNEKIIELPDKVIVRLIDKPYTADQVNIINGFTVLRINVIMESFKTSNIEKDKANSSMLDQILNIGN